MGESLLSEPFPINSANFEAYEHMHQAFGFNDGLEVTSLTNSEYLRSLEDPTSAVVLVECNGQPVSIPLMTSVDNLEWYNKEYFQQVAEHSGLGKDHASIVYYDHLPELLEAYPEAYIAALTPALATLSRGKGVLVTDHLNTDRGQTLSELLGILASMRINARDILPAFDPEARHFNYAGLVRLADPKSRRPQPLTLWDAYKSGVQNAPGVSIEQSLTSDECEVVWNYYKTRFDELSAVDPIRANSPQTELTELLRDARILKAVQRMGGEIVSLTMFGDARHFPWVNQSYYADRYPDEYSEGNVLFFPGAVTKPESKGNVLHVMATVGRLICAAGIDRSVVTYVCNKVSRRPITTISTWALNRTGTVADLTEPVSERIFHAFLLESNELAEASNIPGFPQFCKIDESLQADITAFVNQFPTYSDFNFVSLYCWNTDDNMSASWLNGNLVIRGEDYVTGEIFYSFIGGNRVVETAKKLLEHTPELSFIPESCAQEMISCTDLEVTEDPVDHDYLLSVSELAALKGNRHAHTREAVNRFMRNNAESASFGECDLQDKEVQRQLYKIAEARANLKLGHSTKESEAFRRSFNAPIVNALRGFCVYIHGKAEGFIICEIQDDGKAIAHFSKANTAFAGIYQYQMYHLAKKLLEMGISELNIEQDLGIPGLRDSKRLLRPAGYLKKYGASMSIHPDKSE
jgi:uncharacterized protein